MGKIVKRYDAKLDSKRRLTIRDTQYEYYHVDEFKDGTLLLKPRVLINPNELSENTLGMIEQSMDNLENGVVSNPVNLEKYLKLTEKNDQV